MLQTQMSKISPIKVAVEAGQGDIANILLGLLNDAERRDDRIRTLLLISLIDDFLRKCYQIVVKMERGYNARSTSSD